MIDTKTEKLKQVLLSPKKLEKLGAELIDITEIIAMNNIVLEELDFTRKKDGNQTLWLLRKYINVAYNQNEKLIARLDKIAFLLLNSNNSKELASLRNEDKE